MEHRIEVKPEFKLIGYELRTSHKDGNNSREIPAFWQRYLNDRMGARIPNRIHVDPCVELGICTDFDMEKGEFSYIIGMEVNNFKHVSEAASEQRSPETLISRTFPEAKYAIFTTPKVAPDDFVSSIQNTWKSIFEEWFPHSGYEHAGSAEIELYDARCRSDINDLIQMDIYVPIK